MSTRVIVVLVLIVAMAVGCAAGPNPSTHTQDEQGRIAGFWQGLWHGILAPFTFVLSLFVDSIHFYEVHNNGGWYNFGFVIGAGILFGGSHARPRRRY